MKVGVLIIHGIGAHQTDGPAKLIERLSRQLERHPKVDVVWQVVHWWQITQGPQDRLYARLQPYHLGWPRIRRIAVGTIADAIAYQRSIHGEESVYNRIQQYVTDRFKELKDVDRLVVVAHSLGTIIATDWLWSGGKIPASFVQTGVDLVTMGSPLALWALQLPDGGCPVEPASWVNCYDRRDPIGTPLKPVNEHWEQAVTEDREVCNTYVWPYLQASHTGYWTNRAVVKVIADKVSPLPEDEGWLRRAGRVVGVVR